MENETDEQFEERVLNKRAAQMFFAVRNKMQRQDSIYLSEMTHRNNRKQVSIFISTKLVGGNYELYSLITYITIHYFVLLQAAQKFYSLLVLKKFQALELKQEETFGDIHVTKGIMFDNPKL